MNHFFNSFLSQYQSYQPIDIWLEVIAVIFGLLSVWYSKNNKILVFPTGMMNTAIFVYLLYQWNLLGDMLINAYYFVMSIYGWYLWKKQEGIEDVLQITTITKLEKIKSILLFVLAVLLISGVYLVSNRLTHWIAFVDTFVTAVFFVGMWLMAKKKIENWICWIIGNTISIPMYLYKGLAVTSFQYVVFTILAVFGYKAWKNILNKPSQI